MRLQILAILFMFGPLASAVGHKAEPTSDVRLFCYAGVNLASEVGKDVRLAFQQCEAIGDSDLRLLCFSTAHLSRWLSWRPESLNMARELCNSIRGPDVRHLCDSHLSIAEVAGAVENNLLGGCGEIIDGDLNEYCLSSVYGYELNRKTGHPAELCLSMENPDWLHACVSNFHARRSSPGELQLGRKECDKIGSEKAAEHAAEDDATLRKHGPILNKPKP